MRATRIDQASRSQNASHTPYRGGSREFDGEATLQMLVTPEESGDVTMLAVWFSAGARTRAHIHDSDQILHIMEGQGIVADVKERRTVSAGEVVVVPAHAWHWHGATPDSSMMHISIRKAGGTTDWDVDQKDWAEGYARRG